LRLQRPTQPNLDPPLNPHHTSADTPGPGAGARHALLDDGEVQHEPCTGRCVGSCRTISVSNHHPFLPKVRTNPIALAGENIFGIRTVDDRTASLSRTALV
ncbi:hypothetical protein, partial [Dactylosporangium sp. NPDC051541]|uniref:hypothetical protein n=1 Tax=Dactylosporangium sp. NPDC051541 TaxID=3363977 RepID=UPI00378EE828